MFISAATDTLTVGAGWARPLSALVDRLRDAPAANVADVFDRLLVMDSAIGPVTRLKQLVGPALTIHTRAGDNLAIHRALDDAQPGDVLVISGQGDTTRAVVGDLIGEIMVARGVIGAVVDGAVRDAEGLSDLGLAVFARALTPAGPFKSGPGVIGGSIACAGVVVNAGDIIVADADGVVVVPATRLEWAVDRLDQVISFEAALRARIRASLAPADASPP